MTTKTGGGKITEIESRERAGKRALFLASGSHEADVKSFDAAAQRALVARDDVTVMHYVKGAVATVYGPGRLAGSYGADEDSVRERVGCTRVRCRTRVPRKGGVVAGIHSSAYSREAVEG